MNAVSAVSARATAVPTSSTPTPATPAPVKTLGVNDFMKLLATQFQMQDPMKPMDDTAFIAQTAQFTSLEQATTLTQQMTQMRATQDLQTANSYLGQKLTVNAGQGATVTGDVTAIDASSGTPQLIINGQPYALSTVLRVEPGTASPPAPVPAPATGS